MSLQTIIFTLMSAVMLVTPATAEVVEITSANDAKPYFDQANKDTLIIFDVDYVLTQPADPTFQMPNIRAHKDIYKEVMELLTPVQQDIFRSLAVTSFPCTLVEKDMPSIVAALQQGPSKVIGFTALLTGPLNEDETLEEWRYATLKKRGYDFSISFNDISPFTFNMLPSHRGHFPLFNKGILMANGEANKDGKGIVLREFLAKVNDVTGWTPKVIILVDDNENNLKSVEAMCKAAQPEIKFIGLHYKGAFVYPSEKVDAATFRNKSLELKERAQALASQ